MAQQTINISTPNSNAGDTIRDSFDKCNDNFTELYSAPSNNLDEVTTAGNTTTNSITVGGLIVDTSTLFVDSTNNRVGIGTNVPQEHLHIKDSTAGDFTTIRIEGFTASAGNPIGSLEFYNTTSAPSAEVAGFVKMETEGGRRSYQMLLGTGNAAAADTKMTIDSSGQVGIGTTSPNALLDVSSTTNGVLLPRMTTTQVNAISAPNNGLTVYNTTLNTLCFYNGTSWQKVTSANM
tara:strand:+ start:21 stop:725 length:705 start_codon:yes stop_codon:yes gene_type:complete